MSSDAWRGQKALEEKRYPEAIEHLTKALKESQSPVWLLDRSTAYQRNGQHELALADADNAVLAAIKRAKRELIGKAHFRRALALHGLKRYGDARLCLNWCNKINEKEKGLTLWMGVVKSAYDAAGGDDAEENQIGVKEIPDAVVEVGGEDKKEDKKEKGKEKEVMREEKESAPVVPAPAKATPKEKIRHDWYQSNQSVTIDLLAAGVPKVQVEANFEERSFEISFPIVDSNSTFDFTLSPLYSAINPSKSTYRVTPRKIEITLSKAQPGKWSHLEWTAGANPSEPIPPSLTTTTTPSDPIPSEILNPSTTQQSKPSGPSYPTSSRNGPKNWDKIGDEDGEEESSNPDDFFKKLFKDADDDTKKAMMKSMQESGGTSLSTNWADVKSKTFTPDPPKGMEAKKWEY